MRRRKRLRKKLWLKYLESIGNYDRFEWVIYFGTYGYRGWRKRFEDQYGAPG